MNYLGRVFSGVKGFYNEINSATLTGAIDIIVIEQEDGSLVCSPFHVRFGKMGVLRSREKVVDIEVNGEPVDLHMKLGEAGEAFFVQELGNSAEIPVHLATSPLPPTGEFMRQGLKELKKASESAPVSTPSSHSNDSLTSSNSSQKDVTVLSNSQGLLEDVSSDFKPIHSEESLTENDFMVSRPTAVSSKLKLEIYERDSSLENIDPTSGKRKRRRKRRNRSRNNSVSHDTSGLTLDSKNDLAKVENSTEFVDEEGMFDIEVDELETPTPTVNDQHLLMSRTTSLPVIEGKSQDITDSWIDNNFTRNIHPFSDGDLTPIVRYFEEYRKIQKHHEEALDCPVSSRPPSPKSDTEFENQSQLERKADALPLDDVTWQWGELPEEPRKESPLKPEVKFLKEAEKIISQTKYEHEQPSKQKERSGLFGFVKKAKKEQKSKESEGIYLEDLNLDEMDPEVAALYLYDNTSAGARERQNEDDNESGRGASLPQSPVSGSEMDSETSPKAIFNLEDSGEHFSMSMSLCGGLKDLEGDIPTERFMQDLVTYDDFSANPTLLNDPNLVLKFGDKYYNWQIAGPMIISEVIFKRPLPEHTIKQLIKLYMPKKENTKRAGMSSWFYWRRSAAEDGTGKKEVVPISPPSSVPSSEPSSPHKSATKPTPRDDDYSSSETETDTSEKFSPDTRIKTEKYRKAVRLTSDQLHRLNLKEGLNDVSFSVTTALQGTTRCQAYIFKWRYDDKIIISDIDGTITKSDVLGQILPMVGIADWSQAGVAGLYTKIARNGYKFLYLSARAIGQSTSTRDYLRSICQGELNLPLGPLLLSPSSLISAFHKEVIERKPEEFKISCLRDIQALFPQSRNPFLAGYGNKVNDVWAYRAVGIPISRIFTINHRGELRHELTHTFQSSYTSLSDVVDHMFPPLHPTASGEKEVSNKFHGAQQYSTFTYWREPIIDIENELESVKEPVKDEKAKK